MTTTVNLREAKTHFAQLIERVHGGETVIITRAGKPVAVLSPVARRVPGNDAGKVTITPAFDEPLPEFDVLCGKIEPSSTVRLPTSVVAKLKRAAAITVGFSSRDSPAEAAQSCSGRTKSD